MKIFLHEITDFETELHFSEQEPWVVEAVSLVDEKPLDAPSPRPAQSSSLLARPIRVEFSLRKVDDVVVISGQVDTDVRLICSRCGTPYSMHCNHPFSTLYCKDPVMAGVGYLAEARRGRDGEEVEAAKPAGQNHGHARHAHNENGGAHDLDITYVAEDYVDLGHVLTEQLQLQIPFQPLCKQNCRGICVNCGTDLNRGRCACEKLTRQTPFSILKDLKVQ